MATYSETAERFGDRILDLIKRVDDVAVNATSTVSQRIAGMLPEIPENPVLERLPKPDQLVKSYFDFIERLTKTQRAYSVDLVKAFEPLTRKIWHQARVRKAA